MGLANRENGSGEQRMLETFLDRALLLDLEVSHQGVLLKLGAVLGHSILARPGRAPLNETLRELDTLVERAHCVLGHNLVRHDLPILRERAPQHAIHHLPVVDTLVLSPICFPENPYHRLVKDYKLVRESVNDPVAVARQGRTKVSKNPRTSHAFTSRHMALENASLRALLRSWYQNLNRSEALT